MNKKRMLLVADAIEKEQAWKTKATFDMSRYVDISRCGTSACIAGFASLMTSRETVSQLRREGKIDNANDHFDIGRHVLGLTRQEACILFINSMHLFNRYKKLVPDALRWMAHTGKVDIDMSLKAAACVAENKKKAAKAAEDGHRDGERDTRSLASGEALRAADGAGPHREGHTADRGEASRGQEGGQRGLSEFGVLSFVAPDVAGNQ